MNTPDNIQTLFIRGAKSKDPYTRVVSVYRRFYTYGGGKIDDAWVCGILLKIIEEYRPIKLTDLLCDLSPQSYIYSGEHNYWTKVKQILISHIRLSHKDCFGNMKLPLMFRGK